MAFLSVTTGSIKAYEWDIAVGKNVYGINFATHPWL